MNLEPGYHRRHQYCSIPCDDIISGCGGKAVADNQPQKLHRESQVGLLDGPLRLGQPVGTLSINGQVQGHPPLGGLSQRWLTQELDIFDNCHR